MVGIHSRRNTDQDTDGPDDHQGQYQRLLGAARCQRGHDGLVPLHRDAQQGEHGQGDGQVGGELADGAEDRAKYPVPVAHEDK